jgi:hypothetical protein
MFFFTLNSMKRTSKMQGKAWRNWSGWNLLER